MTKYNARYNLCNFLIEVSSDLQFQLTNRYYNFLASSEQANLNFSNIIRFGIFDFDQLNLNLDLYTKVKTEKCIDFYKNDHQYLKIAYKNEAKKQICWCVTYSIDDYSLFDVYVTAIWYDNLMDFDPLLLIDLSKVLANHDSIMVHSSVVKYKGKGIIFSAPSHTGKSTQADLWHTYYDATILNGDRGIVHHCGDHHYKVYGSPYAGSSEYYLNESADLSMIIILRQAPYNKLRRLNTKEAFLNIVSQTFLSKEDSSMAGQQTDFIINLIQNVPVYVLECLPNKEAVDIVMHEIYGGNDGK